MEVFTDMESTMIPLFKVFMSPEAPKEVERVLMSGYIGQGPRVGDFEKELANYVGNPYVITTNSGTAALQLVLRLIGVKGKKVLTTPMTCTATNWAILAEGGEIEWADITKLTGNISPMSVQEKLIDDSIVAVMTVDWGGYPIDHSFFDELPIPVIEDAAHAFGSIWEGRFTGTLSPYTVFSFQAIKHLTCGDGGAVFLKDEKQYRRGKLLRWYGIDREQPRLDFRCEGDISEWGYKFHMNDIAASIGLSNIKYIKEILEKTRANAQYYNTQLNGISGLTIHSQESKFISSYWLYTIFVENRNDFSRKMAEAGIMVSRVHERNDKHSCVVKYKNGELPNLEWFVSHEVCIPVGWWVTNEDREYIVKVIKEGW